MIKKKCCSCRIHKTIDNFNRNKSTNDGFACECKSCRKTYYTKKSKYADATSKIKVIKKKKIEKPTVVKQKATHLNGNRSIMHSKYGFAGESKEAYDNMIITLKRLIA